MLKSVFKYPEYPNKIGVNLVLLTCSTRNGARGARVQKLLGSFSLTWTLYDTSLEHAQLDLSDVSF